MRKKISYRKYLYITCDLLNGNRLWVSHDVYELITSNPDGVIFETRGERPILVNWYDPVVQPPKEAEWNPLEHPERYLDDAMAIVDDMTMAQRRELLKYLEDKIEGNKKLMEGWDGDI